MFMSRLFPNALSRHARALLGAAILAGGLIRPAPAGAASVEVDGRTASLAGNLVIPCIKVALTAQPEPFGYSLRMAPDNQARPVYSMENPVGRTFRIDIHGMDRFTGLGLTLLPPGPCRDGKCQSINVQAVAADGTRLLFHFDVTSNDGLLDPGTIRGFNPQPDPPGFPAGSMEVDFALAGNGRASVNLTLTVLNQSTGRVVTVQ